MYVAASVMAATCDYLFILFDLTLDLLIDITYSALSFPDFRLVPYTTRLSQRATLTSLSTQ